MSDTGQAPADRSTARYPHKRHLRNYVLDKRLQLRTALWAAGLVLVVAAGVGYFFVDARRDAVEVEKLGNAHLDRVIRDSLQQETRRQTAMVAGGILLAVSGIALLAIQLSHRVAGPAYVLGRLAQQVRDGKLPIPRELRKNDQLQELARDFFAALAALRTRELDEGARLRTLAGRISDPELSRELTQLADEKERRGRGES